MKDPWTRFAWIPLTVMWLLLLITFSVPQREGPTDASGLDVIAVAKLAVRLFGLLGLVWIVVQVWDTPRRPALMLAILPYALFVGWAMLSVAWSPLKSVSIGQVSGLIVCVLLAVTLGLLWRGPQDTSTILAHLSLALFLQSTILVVVDRFISRDLSGLDRTVAAEDLVGDCGLFHPTAAGAMASLGLIVVVLSRLLWGWRWTRLLLWPAVIVFTTLVLVAASRTAAALAVGLGIGAVALLVPGRTRAIGTFVLCTVGTIYLAYDPGLVVYGDIRHAVTAYAKRGESEETIATLTGRTDMWEAMWGSYLHSPVFGHGYFVTSRTGELDVWTRPDNWTAHNVFLQVLVTTGAVGEFLFVVGLAWAALRSGYDVVQVRRDAAMFFFLAFLGIWYFVWGLLAEAFMGPLRPETVVFYVVLGLGLSQMRDRATAPARLGAHV